MSRQGVTWRIGVTVGLACATPVAARAQLSNLAATETQSDFNLLKSDNLITTGSLSGTVNIGGGAVVGTSVNDTGNSPALSGAATTGRTVDVYGNATVSSGHTLTIDHGGLLDRPGSTYHVGSPSNGTVTFGGGGSASHVTNLLSSNTTDSTPFNTLAGAPYSTGGGSNAIGDAPAEW